MTSAWLIYHCYTSTFSLDGKLRFHPNLFVSLLLVTPSTTFEVLHSRAVVVVGGKGKRLAWNCSSKRRYAGSERCSLDLSINIWVPNACLKHPLIRNKSYWSGARRCAHELRHRKPPPPIPPLNDVTLQYNKHHEANQLYDFDQDKYCEDDGRTDMLTKSILSWTVQNAAPQDIGRVGEARKSTKNREEVRQNALSIDDHCV